MKTIERNQVLKALNESIKHWRLILKRVKLWQKRKYFIFCNGLNWKAAAKEDKGLVLDVVSISGDQCALCQLFSDGVDCEGCPLVLIKDACRNSGSSWNKCFDAKDYTIVAVTENMLKALLKAKKVFLLQNARSKTSSRKSNL